MTDIPDIPPAKRTGTPEEAESLLEAVLHARVGDVLKMLRGGLSAETPDPESGRPMIFTVMDINNALDEDDPRCGAMAAIFVNFFAAGKANPDIRTAEGISPLNYALQLQNHFLATVLVSVKADVNERFPESGDTPLHAAVAQAMSGMGMRALNVLLAHGADAAVPNKAGICAYDLTEKPPEGLTGPAAARLKETRALLMETAPVQNLLSARTAARQEELRAKAKCNGLVLKRRPSP
jgi:hypothetical protein